ncbi:MAG: hypothetical protein PHW53_00635 [Patescibacteria group bacterium]|nr:hypothetical protein [Patescibacteria group bacterium]
MRLGPLQKYILIVCRSRRGPVSRDVFFDYYKGKKGAPSLEDKINAITKALEKMIAESLIVGNGARTAEKFFIKTIVLTPGGRRAAKSIFGSQQRLPININNK